MNATGTATLDSLRTRAVDAGLAAAALAPVFDRFLAAVRRHAALETLTLGAVPLTFPAHLFTERPDAEPDPLAAGLALAARERERLDLGHGAIDDVVAVVEAQGLKVVELPIPAEIPLLGAFIFDETCGPALLVGSGPRAARDYALAHEYGHFLADNDPFRTWVCLKGRGAADSPEELRAHAFAGGFLVPGEDLALYLQASSVTKGDPIGADLLRQLRTYFEADDRAVIGRLLADGWLTRGEIGPLMRAVRDDPAEESPDGPALSARLVSLAVRAVRAGKLSLEGMAEHLDVDEGTARRIEESFHVDPEGGDGDADRTR